MPSSLSIFQSDLRKQVPTLTKDELVRYQIGYALNFFRRVVYKTPKDTGHLRYNWQVSINGLAYRIRQGSGPAPNLQEALRILQGVKPFSIVYVSNPEVYAEVWDEGLFVPPDPGPSKDPRPERRGRILVRGGYSTQAPRGMVGPTLAELREIYGT